MALDFPRAWELARAAAADVHHPECSYAQTSGALLCDLACPVIADSPEYQCPAMHGAGGRVVRDSDGYEPCRCTALARGAKDCSDERREQ